MRTAALGLVALLLAGCFGNEAPEGGAYAHSQAFSHDFSNEDPGDAPFAVNVSSQLSYQWTFIGVPAPADSGSVCPMGDTGIAVDLVAPDGHVVKTLEPDIRGVTGRTECGTGDGQVDEAAAGEWRLRYRGEGQARVILTLVAVGYPG